MIDITDLRILAIIEETSKYMKYERKRFLIEKNQKYEIEFFFSVVAKKDKLQIRRRLSIIKFLNYVNKYVSLITTRISILRMQQQI